MTHYFTEPGQWQGIVQDVLQIAQREGASSAEVGIDISDGFTVNVRLGEIETIEYHRDKSLDVTVYIGNQLGSSSTTDISKTALENTVKAACSIAKATGSDPCHGLADPELLAKDYPDLDLYHPWSIDVDRGIELAKQCEAAGLAFDRRIANSDGANLSTTKNFSLYANSNEFMGYYFTSSHSFNCMLIAEVDGYKQRDYEYTVARNANELASTQWVGEQAAQKTLARLNARKLSTRQAPVLFTPSQARGLIGHFLSAIRGGNLYRESSFLLNHLNKRVFPENVTFEERPHLKRRLGSSPFDQEGVETKDRIIVADGILQSYILDTYTARKLGMQTTGNAGGISNLLINPTAGDLNILLKKMDTGLLVTELLGQGVNIVTGDYSRGAAGFWVERGEIQFPVHEITIAGHLKEMFMQLLAIGSDVDNRGHICTGSILIENMTIAGS